MAWQAVNRAIGGITPLGMFTITPATPQNILANLDMETVRYAFQCRQIGFSVAPSPSGEVYVNYSNIAGLGNQTVMVIRSTDPPTSLPIGTFAKESMIDASQYWLDGSEACVVFVFAVDGTSS